VTLTVKWLEINIFYYVIILEFKGKSQGEMQRAAILLARLSRVMV